MINNNNEDDDDDDEKINILMIHFWGSTLWSEMNEWRNIFGNGQRPLL